MSFFSLITGSFRNADSASGVFSETEPYEKGFSAHYIKFIKPHVDSFEASRQKALEKASWRARMTLPLTLVLGVIEALIFILCGHSEETFKLMSGVGGGSLLGMWWWVHSPIRAYKDSIKTKIFPNIISFLGDYQYSPSCPDRVSALKDSDIIPSYDRETSEDAFSGDYKGVKIDLFETNLEEKRRSKNSTYYVSIFKGVVITLSVHKNFKGKTIIRTDGGMVGNWFKKTFSSLENVKLEDPRFEKIFEVYSSDQIEARYLLTTAFMDRLLQLGEAYGSKKIECSFYKNKLLMMIPIKRNLFEPSDVFKAEDFGDDAKSLLKEMNLIFQIIEILKLDQNIGM